MLLLSLLACSAAEKILGSWSSYCSCLSVCINTFSIHASLILLINFLSLFVWFHQHIFHSCFRPLFHNRKIWGVGLMYLQIHTYLLNLLIFTLQSCNMQLTDEPEKRCYPLGDHLYCRSCHIRQGEKLGYTSSESVRCETSILIIGSNNQIPICES